MVSAALVLGGVEASAADEEDVLRDSVLPAVRGETGSVGVGERVALGTGEEASAIVAPARDRSNESRCFSVGRCDHEPWRESLRIF